MFWLRRHLFGRFFDKLIAGYALDAIESYNPEAAASVVRPGRARAFVESLKKAKGRRHEAVSLGATITFASRVAAGFQRFSSRQARQTGHRD